MPKPTGLDKKFVAHLESLREDRAALAALRQGLGQPPGAAPQMYPYIEPWLTEVNSARLAKAYYLIAALFAYHPQPGGSGTVGHHFADIRNLSGNDTAVERRFTILLAAHRDDLPFYLRQAVSFLKAKAIPVNWVQLLKDVRGWDHPDRYVQQRWARAYWGGMHSPAADQMESSKRKELNEV